MKIEIHDENRWRTAAEINLLGKEGSGPKAKCMLEYDMDYAIEKIDAKKLSGSYALSCLHDIDLATKTLEQWPAFLMDLFPQGAALKYVVDHYRIPDSQGNYWKILNTAVLSPPGNLRVKIEKEDQLKDKPHSGFEKEEVIAKGADFLEYMIACGAPVSGTTGAGGAAPKFLLREDHQGRYHGDRVLPDDKTKNCWIVKFPRGESFKKINREILKAEKFWYDIAGQCGINIGQKIHWHPDCIFIKRFDRKVSQSAVEYYGLESFYSLVDSVEYGSRFRHKTYTDALAKYSTNPEADILEYIKRDILNLAMGNTDNHGRNQSVLKIGTQVRLSPLYDFAPMKFDPEGIPRNTRWEDDGNFLNEARDLLSKEYGIQPVKLKAAVESLWQKYSSIDFKCFDIPETILEDVVKKRSDMEGAIDLFLSRSK